MNIRRDIWSIATEHAFLRRQWQWAGIGGSDVCAYLTGRVIVPPDQVSGPLYRYDAVLKELILSTYHLSERVAESYVEAMRSVGAVALVAYPSSATSLARAMLSRDLRLPLRAVLTSSETLQPEARKLISEAFGCPVYDFYGSAERVCYIHTCEEGTYHVIPEYGVTEFVSTGDSPNRCTVVATGFWNRAMPLFRYALGDVIESGEDGCPCGRAFPTVRRVVGRAQDYLITPSGRELGAALLTHLLYGARNIVESQLTQDAPDHVIMSYVPDSRFNEDDRQSLLALIQAHLPSELKVELKPVAALPRTRSGKVRPIVNLVRKPNDVSADP